jgi:ferritin-like metal-binding protein YciE
MGLFGHEEFNRLEDLLKHNLEDILDAENRLLNALPKMAEKATNVQLKQAFESHLEETKGQVERLKQVFASLNWEAERETCPAMKGLIKEGEEMLDAKGDNDTIDAALIMSAQRVEHYEMAAYGAARCQAAAIGRDDVAQMLQKTLDEEHEADAKLAKLAVEVCNRKAAV